MKKIIEVEKILDEQIEGILNHRFIMAYLTAIRYGSDELIFDDCGFEYDVEQTIENLERFGIKRIVITDSSSGLMNALKVFTDAGFHILGMKEQEFGYNWENEAIYKNGLILQK